MRKIISSIIDPVTSYFKGENKEDRLDWQKQKERTKDVETFWQNFDKLPLEEKSWILDKCLTPSWPRLISGDEANEIELKNLKFDEIRPEWLWPRTIIKLSKLRIKQEKIKVEKQKELQSSLSWNIE